MQGEAVDVAAIVELRYLDRSVLIGTDIVVDKKKGSTDPHLKPAGQPTVRKCRSQSLFGKAERHVELLLDKFQNRPLAPVVFVDLAADLWRHVIDDVASSSPEFTAWPVDRRVNNARNEGADLISQRNRKLSVSGSQAGMVYSKAFTKYQIRIPCSFVSHNFNYGFDHCLSRLDGSAR